MGSEENEKLKTRATPPRLHLQLFSLPPIKSPEHPASGTLTPPHETHAAVPFRWEDEPGRPKHPTALTFPPDPTKSLDLPPRLLVNESKITKTPSPTTVLEGPYPTLGRSILESSSFRFLRKRQGSFDGVLSLGGSGDSSPDRGLLGPNVLTSSGSFRKDKGVLGSWRKRGATSFSGCSSKSEVHCGGSLVISSFSDDDGGKSEKGFRMRRRKSSLLCMSPVKSQLWASIYGALKHIIPRKSKKWRRDGL